VLAKDGFWDTEDWIIHVKCCYVLVTDGEVTADEFMAALPDVDVLASLGIWRDPADSRKMNQFSRWTGLTSLVYAALALEKLGQHDAAMPYVTKALDEDQTQGGSGCRWHHAMAHCCRGRLGRRKRRGLLSRTLSPWRLEALTGCWRRWHCVTWWCTWNQNRRRQLRRLEQPSLGPSDGGWHGPWSG
jgi:hypothetical protein